MEFLNLEKKLPVKIKRVWRITASLFTALLLLICTSLYFFISSQVPIVKLFSSIGFAVVIMMALIYAIIIPIRFKRWSYKIGQGEIEIQKGIFFRTRVLIPMIRIQHVETKQGPLLRQQSLVSLAITTAADTHEIEAVEANESDELRHYILELVKVAKEDV